LGSYEGAAQLPAACLKLLRFQPVPYTLHGKLILKPVDGATDLLWTGADNPQAAQCPALRALIDHCWFKFRLVGNLHPLAILIEVREDPQGRSRDEVALEVEGVVDGSVHTQKALSGSG